MAQLPWISATLRADDSMHSGNGNFVRGTRRLDRSSFTNPGVPLATSRAVDSTFSVFRLWQATAISMMQWSEPLTLVSKRRRLEIEQRRSVRAPRLFSPTGKQTIVIGASRGISRAIAPGFADLS